MTITECLNKYNIDINDAGWFFIDSLDFMTREIKYALYQKFHFGKNFFGIDKYKQEYVEICGEENYNNIKQNCNAKFIEQKIKELGTIKFISINNENFPEKMKNAEIVFIFYYKGNLSLLNSRCMYIANTRNHSPYAVKIINTYLPKLALTELNFILGINDGLDMLCHTTLKNSGKKIIAITYNGFNKSIPAHNRKKLVDIVKNDGLIISAMPPNVSWKGNLSITIMNDLILSACVAGFIAEGTSASGIYHLVSQNEQLYQGLSFYTVPGNIGVDTSVLPNVLIKEKLANISLDPIDIIDDLNLSYIKKNEQEVNFSEDELLVLNAFEKEQLVSFNFLLEQTKLSAPKLLSTLTILTIKKKLSKLAGNMYSKI